MQGLALLKQPSSREQQQLLQDAANYLGDVAASSSPDADAAVKASAAAVLRAVNEQLEVARLR